MNKPNKKPTANENAAIESARSCIADGITLGSRGLLADAIESFDKAIFHCHNLKRKSAPVQLLSAQALGNNMRG